jgi:phosphomannomutase/phosphoglucomutase
MNLNVFREYDIRGVADRDLTDELAHRIGERLSQMLRPESSTAPARIAVGRDCRLSSPRLFTHLVQGLISGGAHVLDVGVGPTPMLYFAVHHLESDGGVMITGSHNPAEDNGFKIMRGKAAFFGDALRELSKRVEQGVGPGRKTGSVEATSVADAYLKRLTQGLEISDRSFKLVVDAGNGSAGPLGLRALQAAGFQPEALFCEMDGTFPNHHPDPTVPKNLEFLIERVRSEQARVGIAWDGDGDRLGVVDSSGEVVWGDKLLVLFARQLLRERPGATVLADVKCSQLLFDDVRRQGGSPIMWKTGHSLIKTKMRESGALLAGEMSGHFFFADRYYGYDDAIYAALRLLEILSREGRSVLELVGDLPTTYATPEIRVECPEQIKFKVVEQVTRKLREEGELCEIDGARITYGDGSWGLVRASNTGPVIVLRFEAPTSARLEEIRRHVEGVVEEAQRALGGPA